MESFLITSILYLQNFLEIFLISVIFSSVKFVLKFPNEQKNSRTSILYLKDFNDVPEIENDRRILSLPESQVCAQKNQVRVNACSESKSVGAQTHDPFLTLVTVRLTAECQ